MSDSNEQSVMDLLMAQSDAEQKLYNESSGDWLPTPGSYDVEITKVTPREYTPTTGDFAGIKGVNVNLSLKIVGGTDTSMVGKSFNKTIWWNGKNGAKDFRALARGLLGKAPASVNEAKVAIVQNGTGRFLTVTIREWTSESGSGTSVDFKRVHPLAA